MGTEKKAEESGDDEVRVQLDVSARGFVYVEMTRAEFEERFPDGEAGCELDEIITDWTQLVDDLQFEIDDAYIIEPKKRGKASRVGS
jgi:hypothetical protein